MVTSLEVKCITAAFLIGASIKSKAVWLYKPVLFLIGIEERSITGSLLTEVLYTAKSNRAMSFWDQVEQNSIIPSRNEERDARAGN